MSISNAKSMSSRAQCWNHSWQTSSLISEHNLATGHSHRSFVCLFFDRFQGLHYSLAQISLKGVTIFDLTLVQAFSRQLLSTSLTPILKLSLNSYLPIAWSTELPFDILLFGLCYQNVNPNPIMLSVLIEDQAESPVLVTKKTQGDIQIGHMCFALNSISTQCSKILFDIVKKICR